MSRPVCFTSRRSRSLLSSLLLCEVCVWNLARNYVGIPMINHHGSLFLRSSQGYQVTVDAKQCPSPFVYSTFRSGNICIFRGEKVEYRLSENVKARELLFCFSGRRLSRGVEYR